MHFISHKSVYLRNQRYSHSFSHKLIQGTAGGRGGKERKLRVEQEKHVKAKERKWESQRDKSSSVERWQGWSWMQPLWAWWLIATKMSTCPRCSHCSHSARGVFINTVAPTSQKGDGACVLQVESLCKRSVFVSSKNEKELHNPVLLKSLFFSVPPCFCLMER